MKRGLFIIIAIIFISTSTDVFAQQERPLAEMALQREELPEDVRILDAGPTSFDDISQPINSENSRSFRAYEFIEAYKVSFVGERIHGGHYLYRYSNSTQAEEQATRLVTYALHDKAARRLHPVILQNQGVKSHVIRFSDPETGGVYYWFIGVKGRTLMLLFVGGLSNEGTRSIFDSLKQRVQQR